MESPGRKSACPRGRKRIAEHGQGDASLDFLEHLLVDPVTEPFALIVMKVEDVDFVEPLQQEPAYAAMQFAPRSPGSR